MGTARATALLTQASLRRTEPAYSDAGIAGLIWT